MKRLSVDVGFGDIKVGYMDSTNHVKPEYTKHLSLVADIGTGSEDTGNFVEYEGKCYVIGTPALQLPKGKQMRMETYEEFKELSPIVIKKHLRDHPDVEQVIISLSLAFEEHAGEYKEYVCDKLGLKQENVFLLPQGVGAKIALDSIGFNLEDISYKANLFNYIMVDIGYNTVDVINVVDGYLIKSGITGYPGIGVIRIVKDILAQSGDLPLSEGLVKSAITSGGKVSSRNVAYDISDKIEQASLKYVSFFHDFLEKEYKEQIDSIDHIILIGGGAELLNTEKNRAAFDEFYKHDFVKTPVMGAEYYNALGGLYFPDKSSLK